MTRRWLSVFLAWIVLPAVLLAQVNNGYPPYVFTSGTTISSSEVNANFSQIFGDALNRTAGTMTGTLTTQNVVPSADNTYDLGTSGARWRNIYVVGSVGSVGGSLSALSTTPPQLTVGYDSSNKWETSVTSAGAVTFNASGGSAGFTFADPIVGSGTVTSTGALTASTGLTVTSGGVTVTAGGLALTAGPLTLPIRTETSSPQTAATADVVIIVDSASAFTLNLYACSGNTGKVLIIKDLQASDITVDPDGSEQIDGSGTKTISTTTQATIICNGTAWYTIG